MHEDDHAPVLRFSDLPLIDQFALGALIACLIVLMALSVGLGLAWLALAAL